MSVESRIRIWLSSIDYITLDYAQARLSYSQSGERIRDRNGLLHRVAPPGARYPVRLTLRLLAEELLTQCSAGSAYTCVLDWLTTCFRVQAQLVLYMQDASLGSGGSQISRQIACAGYIDTMCEDFSASLSSNGSSEYVELEFHVYADGTFSSFDTLSSYQAYTPARPV
jgi:hypothetical protein